MDLISQNQTMGIEKAMICVYVLPWNWIHETLPWTTAMMLGLSWYLRNANTISLRKDRGWNNPEA